MPVTSRPFRAVCAPAVRSAPALPADLAGAALLLAGQPARAARLHARTWGPGHWTPGHWTPGRRLARTVLGLPLDALALLLAGYAAFNSVRNFGYPIWYLGTDYHQAWGGPTMAGVWAVHVAGWALCLYVLLRRPVRWIARAQQSLAARLGLAARPTGPGAVALAVVAPVGAAVSS
ncbi:hypothetical protein [Kitasatospora sp. CB01950]|uniref:hypothetical protein n=1 Tax=Kitasatospora sp. CB01950 TaxID=1703930 RepID=UPI000939B429|nr:hypothetical protein [Kitasatospora sp. CB01950]OKI99191.1 hypothetical protein AMK19_30965 [Kitasatospora sp. CB01950]